jgi:hypothetical protein
VQKRTIDLKGDNLMTMKKNTYSRMLRWTLTTGIAGLFMAPACLAGQTGRTIPAIRPITPVTPSDNASAHSRAANFINVVGRLSLINSNQVAIGNRKFTVGRGVDLSRFRNYNLVGATLDEHGNVVALKLISDEPN